MERIFGNLIDVEYNIILLLLKILILILISFGLYNIKYFIDHLDITAKIIAKDYNRPYIGVDFFHSFKYNKNVFYIRNYDVEKSFQVFRNFKILISHHSDVPATEELYEKFLKCGKFRYWFSQNFNFKETKRAFAIPIGMESTKLCYFSKYDIMMEEKKKNITPSKLLYASFKTISNEEKRWDCINTFKNKSYLTNKVNKFPSLRKLKIEDYRKFVDEILAHQFVLCPEGNGIDTHRFWEVIYLGRYPVVLHNNVTDIFNDLPVLILNNWTEFESKYKKFLDETKNKTYNFEKLTPSYWINLFNSLE